MKRHPFPYWIDTGIDGSVINDGESIPIGGNEEITVMARVIQDYPNAFFVHNTCDILNFANQTGTGVTFEQKLKRKVLVADYYFKNRLYMNSADVWSHLVLIDNKDIGINVD